MRADGSELEQLTEGSIHTGFPSYSPDGESIVYRDFTNNSLQGLRIMNLADKSIRNLTTELDNLPFWSPDGQTITFSRRTTRWGWEIATIRPDGTDVKLLTNGGALDGHGVWTEDGSQIVWTSSMYGFRQEVSIYEDNFVGGSVNMIMNADGSDKKVLTDSIWEDSFAFLVPNRLLS